MIGVVDYNNNGPPLSSNDANIVPMKPRRRSIPQRRVSMDNSPRPAPLLLDATIAAPPTSPLDIIASPRRRIVRVLPKSTTTTEEEEEVSITTANNENTNSVVAKQVEQPTMPTLYRHAKEQAWDQVAVDCQNHPEEARYVCPREGTNALHLAVMSRVGYSLETENVLHQAPLSLIEQLLQAHPDGAMVKCNINTYTPLAYACLVSESKDCCLEETDELVRLFLTYCPQSTSVYTRGGLSAVDVHIVSYSQVMRRRKDEQDDTHHLSGRTSTVVLRTLLENNQSLANVRISKDKHHRLGGPIEILYRCNSRAFLEIVAQFESNKQPWGTTRATTTHSSSLPAGSPSFANQSSTTTTAAALLDPSADKNKSVLARISNWWVWTWTVLILKYETLPKKKRGARFFALQAASGVAGCPIPILTLAMNAFPNQVKEKDEMHSNVGNLPLHEVCSWPCDDSASTDPVISSRKGMAISALLQWYPTASTIRNKRGETPLDLALASGTTWDGGVRKLIRCYPASASVPSSTTGLLPFMTAAVVARSAEKSSAPLPSTKRSLMAHLKNMAKRDLQTIRTIYGILRADPTVMIQVTDDEQSSNSSDKDHGNDKVVEREERQEETDGWVYFGGEVSSPTTNNNA